MSIEGDRGRYNFGILHYSEVDTYADLPDATLNAGAIYIVKTSSGVWLINRKEAGLWRSNGVIWYRLGDWLAAFDDGNFQLYDNLDNTKLAMFQCSGISAGATRTFTFPDSNGTLAFSLSGSFAAIDNYIDQVVKTTSPPTFAGLTLTATTGVTLTGAAQVLTLAGIGGTHNESLTIDFDGAAANTIYFGTGSGATGLNFGSFNLLTTGTLGAGATTLTSTDYPVADIIRSSAVTSAILAAARLKRTISSGTVINDAGVGFFFESPNNAGTSIFCGMFGGRLSSVVAGTEIGSIVFGASWQNANPAGNNHLEIRATSATTANVYIPVGSLGIGIAEANQKLQVEGSSGATYAVIHDSRSTTGDVAGLIFSTVIAEQNAFGKSMIIHKETGAWGIGDLIFCVDSNADQAGVVEADEKMKIASSGAVTMQSTLGVTGLITATSGVKLGATDPGGAVSTNTLTGITDTPTADPGWATSDTVAMTAPNGYIKAYVGTQAVVIPYWNT